MLARRRAIADGEPGLLGSLQCTNAGDLYVSFSPVPPPGGDPGTFTAVDITDPTFTLPGASPNYAFPVASFSFGYTGETNTNNVWAQFLKVLHGLAAPAVAPISQGTLAVAKPLQWTAVNTAAANIQATVTRAAGGALTRNIVQGFEFTLSGAGGSLQDLRVRIRDGAGGTILWESYIYKAPFGQSVTISVADISLPCSINTAAVAEFSGVPGDPNCFESVAMRGITVNS